MAKEFTFSALLLYAFQGGDMDKHLFNFVAEPDGSCALLNRF